MGLLKKQLLYVHFFLLYPTEKKLGHIFSSEQYLGPMEEVGEPSSRDF